MAKARGAPDLPHIEDDTMILQGAKPEVYLLLCCVVLGPLTGVAAAPTATDESTADTNHLDRARREWAETVGALKDYSTTQRDAAVARAERTLDAMDLRIEQLEARTRRQWDKLSQSAREARGATLSTLRKQRNQVAEWYGAMKHSSAGAWESVKHGFIDSYAVLSDSFREAWNEFGDEEEETP